MIISYERKFVFVHIPKCAGTSIAYTLKPFLGEKDRFFTSSCQHLRAKDARSQYFSSTEEWKSYFVFAFYRNPWERLHSLFCFEKEAAKRFRGQFDMSKQWHRRLAKLDTSLRFSGFILSMYKKNSDRSTLKRFCFDKGRNIMSFIGRVENMGEDWPYVCQQIGLTESPELLQMNTTYIMDHRRPCYREAYNKKTRRMVFDMFKFDIEYFGYKFDDCQS